MPRYKITMTKTETKVSVFETHIDIDTASPVEAALFAKISASENTGYSTRTIRPVFFTGGIDQAEPDVHVVAVLDEFPEEIPAPPAPPTTAAEEAVPAVSPF